MVTPFVGPDNPLGYPAPYLFILFFKVLGFSLHMVPMHLWYAGLVTLLLARRLGGEHGRRLSQRLINALPVIVAYGINLGIVPLLFTQVAYYKVFYPATILAAWPWFAVIPLLTAAYYGVYIYVIGLRRGSLGRWHQACGWGAAAIFIVLGFIFANTFSLMTNLAGWPRLWEANSAAGASLGLAFNTAQASFWPRWLMMFGLALTTTAAAIVVDAGWFAAGESEGYRRWARRVALAVYTLGMAWFALAGTWYFFGTLAPEVRARQLQGAWLALTALTAVGPGAPWLLILAAQKSMKRGLALAIGVAQFGVIALNAVSRQAVQNAELAPYLNPGSERVATQWSPMIVFLVLFVAGLGVVAWMLAQVARAGRSAAT